MARAVGAAPQIGSLLGSATWSNSTAVLGIDTTSGNFTYGGNITQGLALSKLGANTLTLTGSSTNYPGATTVSAGSLQLGDGLSGSDVSLATSGMSNNAAVLYNVFGTQTANYPISGSGSLTKLGPGLLALGGSNTYSGNTLVSQGTLQLGSNLALQNSVLDTTGTGALVFSSGVNTPTLGGPHRRQEPAHARQCHGAYPRSRQRHQPDLFRRFGQRGQHVAHRHGVRHASALRHEHLYRRDDRQRRHAGGREYPLSSSFSVAGGAGLTVRTASGTAGWTSGQITSLLAGSWGNNAVLGIDTSNGNFTYGGSITQGLALSKLGANSLTLTGSNTSYSGATAVSGGSLQLGDGIGGSDVSLATSGMTNNAAVLYNVGLSQTASYSISGNGSLTKLGAGVLTLGGSNTYSLGTTLSAGQLNINNASALGTGPFTISGGTIDNTSGGSITLSTGNAQSWNGNFIYAGSTNSLNLGTGAVTLGGNRQVTVAANTLTVGGPISGGYSLTKAGNGTLTLGGSNTYSGGTTLSTGQLNVNNASALGTGTFTISGGTIDNTSGGNFTLSTNNPQNWNGNFTYLGSANNLNLGTGAVTLSANRQVTVTANTLTVGGNITGNANSLTKAGNGMLTLSGVNNIYTGGTTISGWHAGCRKQFRAVPGR